MKKIKVPTRNIGKFAGKWVVIDPQKELIIAVGSTLKEIRPLVTHSINEKVPPVGKAPYSFLVPRKDEGPYTFNLLGREVFFNNFRIIFEEKKNYLKLE